MAPFCPRAQLQLQLSQSAPQRVRTNPSDMHRFQRPEPLPLPPTRPKEFIHKIVGPLNKYKEPSVSAAALDQFRVTMTTMDFATGKVDTRCRRLLNLPDARDVESAVLKAKPWVEHDGLTCFDDYVVESYITKNPGPRNYHRAAADFATVLQVWATHSAKQTFKDSLLGQTSWRQHSEPQAARWLGMPDNDDYIWGPTALYYNFKHGIKGTPALDPEKPHAVCYVVDSTPFDVSGLRTSELKTIVLLAIYNHVKPEYNHLDSYGVTVISFWDRDIRIVQGLVNLKTLDIDIRVTEPQRFHKGFRGKDGSVDERFSTILAYNSADVLPPPKY